MTASVTTASSSPAPMRTAWSVAALVAISGSAMALSTPRINTSAGGGTTNFGQVNPEGGDNGDTGENGIDLCTSGTATDEWLQQYYRYVDAYTANMSIASTLFPDSFKAFVGLNNPWIPILPVPQGADNPFPNQPTIIYYSFLSEAMLDVEWVEGVDEANLIGALDDMGMPLETDQIPEGWETPPGRRLYASVIPPPTPATDTEPGVSAALTMLGLGTQIWGSERPAFTHPDGYAVWTYAQSTWGPVSGDGSIGFQDTFDSSQVVDEELRTLMTDAMNIIQRTCNVIFIERDPLLRGGYPFSAQGDPLNPLASLIDPSGGDAPFDPRDDYPWILIVNATDARTGSTGNFAAGSGLGRFPVEIDYSFDDLNGDGFPDAVDLGLGAPALTRGNSRLVGNNPTSIIISDLTADGLPELITSNLVEDSLTFFTGIAGGDFGLSSTLSVAGGPSGVASADFNGDGFNDLAVSLQNTNRVRTIIGATTTDIGTGAGSAPAQVLTADFDGANGPDILVRNPGSGTLGVLFNDGTGAFSAPTLLAAGTPGGMVVLDANGDGFPDIASTEQTNNRVRLYTNDGTGAFTAANIGDAGAGASDIDSADFNADGNADLVILNSTDNSFTVLLGAGDGTFAAAGAATTVFAQPVDVAINDFNGDAVPDLAIVGQTSNNVTVFAGQNNGRFTPYNIIPGPVDIPLGGPVGVATFDLAADGFNDLIVLEQGTNSVTFIVQTPSVAADGIIDGIDLSAGGGAPGDGISDVVDTNGDGIPEIVINGVTYLDITGDGIPDTPDRDLNGIPDDINGQDLDGDGVLDDFNNDGFFDGDGIPDPTPFPFFFGGFLEANPIILINMQTRSIGTAVHELLHTMGYIHEHQRPDRDQFIEVREENIIAEFRGQFTRSLSVPNPGYISDEYDFESVMHYSSFAFTNGRGPTIVVNEEFRDEFGDEIGQRNSLSDIDAQSLQDIYGINPDGPFPWFFGKNPDCPVDVNEDGAQTPADITLFLQLWEDDFPEADITEDGAIDGNDIAAFYAALISTGLGPCNGGGLPGSVGAQQEFRRSLQTGGQ